MSKQDFIHKRLPLIILVLSLILFAISMTGNISTRDEDRIAERIADRIQDRMDVLDRIISQTLSTHPAEKSSPKEIASDLVVYRYVNDSLASWLNQFPLLNDDITKKMVFQRLTPLNNRIESPLHEVTDSYSYICLGPKWYLVKQVDGIWNDKVIAGIEIKNTLLNDSDKAVTSQPLSFSEGTPVIINGSPLFKITYDESANSPLFDNSMLRWIAMLLLSISLIMFLAGHRTFKVFFMVVPVLCILTTVSYSWIRQMNDTYEIFSDEIFADNFFPSLGALLLINAFIFMLNICIFIIKGRINHFICNNPKKRKIKAYTYGVFILICLLAILAYIHFSLRSFIINSSVSLEIYKASSNFAYTVLVYLSYTSLLACVPLLLQSLRPAIHEITGKSCNFLTRRLLVLYAFVCAAYFTVTASIHGLHKEHDKVAEWAETLAIDRDPDLEDMLLRIEDNIADDRLISNLSTQENSGGIILNRIKEYHLNNIEDTYDITITILNQRDKMGQSIFNEIIHKGTPLAKRSRFMFMYDKTGNAKYAGVFLYYNRGVGVTRVVLQMEPKTNKEGRGYSNILSHFRKYQKLDIPPIYSYAKYKNGFLTTYKGTFPYPNVDDVYKGIYDSEDKVISYREGDYVHFIARTSENELIVMSRMKRTGMIYFTSMSYLFLCLVLMSFLIPTRSSRKATFKSNYFRTRISIIIFISSFLLLSCMAIISITFVYKRNEQNMFNMMKARVSTIQEALEKHTRNAKSWRDLSSTHFASILDDIGNATKSDVSLYSPEGKIFRSTSPEIFESRILGSRINEHAFYNIQSRAKRFYIQQEKIDTYRYWTLYAPILNGKGEIIAIMCIPYTDTDYDFMKESFSHAAIIINVFVLLLIISLIITNRIINSMFSPLVEMGNKMTGGNINKLEYIIYKRDDEISSLVDAYNRMVKDLSDSTVQLAQAERDKAWSQMARQVAHEIKNPLTPIKLEIQRLIRLKQNGNPKWEEKFDKVTAVVLEHIQILSDTANEFSTFAKLYTEEPVLMDLDKVLQDQIMIFDNKDNIEISYIGMENAIVMAPKPQLIRVFVNLITNAIQAVEIHQKEAIENGMDVPEGKVLICLRHGTKDGFYDIAVEDNGPGVKGENLDKLFTPNFTTKSGGTGLGLAICRNIIEKCDGEISYQKSFTLDGASFIVSIPKHNP